MKRYLLSALIITLSMTICHAKTKTVTLHVIESSDVHGCFFPWDFINKRQMQGSLARLSSYVGKMRRENPEGVILLENGDILQGQPINYYYNYIETEQPNIASQCVNYMKYDVQNWGNHDVETGHAVYDKWDAELQCPVVGANIIDTKTGQPYLKPYTIVERQGVRVAVLGMLTAAIPNWLPEKIWSGLQFKEMVSDARKWVSYIQQHENPDVIIGLFHSGLKGGITTPDYTENVSLQIAREVPGFDAIMFGHDHSAYCDMVTSSDGSKVLAINPANNAQYAAEAKITVTKNGKKLISKNIEGQLVNLKNEEVDQAYLDFFQGEIDGVKQWADRKIGEISETITTRDCFFGSSAFTDLIHNLQLQLTGADISISAPLTFNATLRKGDITVSDMFKLYKFENNLYTMKLSGKEIRLMLEMSYNLWVNTMTSPDDHIMLLNTETRNNNERNGFKNLTFNFDSAAGIDYEVDVTKPDGQKVHILQMSNGQPFDEDHYYTVAVNSYRGNGGGELLTKGAGIPKEELEQRILTRTNRDQRYYLMHEIERQGIISPKPNNNWRFVPEEWAVPALARDRQLIFGDR